MIKADLHVHTSNTDCSETPETVFEMAKKNCVTTISITDHDTLYGIEKYRDLSQRYGINYIPGVEVSAYDYKNSIKCHIIGLNVHEGYKPLDYMLKSITEERHKISRAQIRKLIKLGYNIDEMDFENTRGVHGYYKQHIMDVLIKKGYADNIYGRFYNKMFQNGGDLHIDLTYPSYIKVITLLRKSGALPVLAHPTLYGNLCSLQEMVNAGLKGIEAVYPSADYMDREKIEELAHRYGLFISGGSDYHGRYSGQTETYVGSHYVDDINFLLESTSYENEI